MFRRDPEFRGADFSVRIAQGFRELVTVVHTRGRMVRNLEGERIGKRWQGIGLDLPRELDPDAIPQIVGDLQTAFAALRCGYVITRTTGFDAVPEAEQQAAIAEMREMGWEVERSPDGKQLVQKRIPGARPSTTRSSGEEAARMMSLIETLRGTRPRVEVLAVSPDFAADVESHIPR